MLLDRHTVTAAGEQFDMPIYRVRAPPPEVDSHCPSRSLSSPLSSRQNLAKKRFLYYWAPFSAWRIGNDWETATAIAASANGDRAHCPSKVSRLHTASANGGWNESALLSVTCS